ncbi:hypothetical protein [Lysobacter gummosus]
MRYWLSCVLDKPRSRCMAVFNAGRDRRRRRPRRIRSWLRWQREPTY